MCSISCLVCVSMRQCGWLVLEDMCTCHMYQKCVWIFIWHVDSHIVYVVRQCGWQYSVCGDEFAICDKYMSFYVVKRGEKQNRQHIWVLLRSTSVGYCHYRRKLIPVTSISSDHSRWKSCTLISMSNTETDGSYGSNFLVHRYWWKLMILALTFVSPPRLTKVS
jgi:hypothetical protein